MQRAECVLREVCEGASVLASPANSALFNVPSCIIFMRELGPLFAPLQRDKSLEHSLSPSAPLFPRHACLFSSLLPSSASLQFRFISCLCRRSTLFFMNQAANLSCHLRFHSLTLYPVFRFPSHFSLFSFFPKLCC